MSEKAKTMSVMELVHMFPGDEIAENWFIKRRWKAGITCPNCQSTKVSERKNTRIRAWRCNDCRKDFSTKTGTVMHGSKLGFKTWAWAIYLITTNIKGIASTKMARDLNIRQATAWHLAMRLREVYKNNNTLLDTIVEVDETYIGGKEANKHANKKLRAGRGTVGKQIVVGMKSREGTIVGKVVTTITSDTLHNTISEHVEKGATVITDDHRGYIGIDTKGYQHLSVNHSAKQYVNGMAHTNGIESFWSLLKRGYYGIHHHMSRKHLSRYVTEFAQRMTNKGMDTVVQMGLMAGAMEGVRLPYAELIQ